MKYKDVWEIFIFIAKNDNSQVNENRFSRVRSAELQIHLCNIGFWTLDVGSKYKMTLIHPVYVPLDGHTTPVTGLNIPALIR